MKKSNHHFLRGMPCLILAQMMVGVNIVFSKYVLISLPILFVLTIRFTLASIILLPLHWLTPAKRLSFCHYFSLLTRRDWGFIIAQALSAGVLFNGLMLWGLHDTDANVAGIITSALPAMIVLMSWVMLGEKISTKTFICIGFATIGLMVIAYDKLNGINGNHSFVGDAIILLSLLPEAAYYILTKMHPSPLPVFLISSLLNGINALLLFCLSFNVWHGFNIQFLDGLILVILGLSSGFFYVFWYIGSQKVDGVMASLSTAVMPLATILIAWLFLNEQVTSTELIGMSMVIFSIGVYAKR